MFPTDFLIFLQIILFLFITPGPPRVVIVSHTLNYGINKSIWTAIGDISANFCQGILVVFFIGTFLSDNPDILQMLKWAGILYLIYLAYDTYTSRIRIVESGNKNLRSIFSFYRDGFLVAGLSPKSMIYAFAANKVSIWLKDNPKVLNTISACVLIIIAVYVAASQNY